MENLLLSFEDPQEIKEHLRELAYTFVASPKFEMLEPAERSNWLFKHTLLIKYFEKVPPTN